MIVVLASYSFANQTLREPDNIGDRLEIHHPTNATGGLPGTG